MSTSFLIKGGYGFRRSGVRLQSKNFVTRISALEKLPILRHTVKNNAAPSKEV